MESCSMGEYIRCFSLKVRGASYTLRISTCPYLHTLKMRGVVRWWCRRSAEYSPYTQNEGCPSVGNGGIFPALIIAYTQNEGCGWGVDTLKTRGVTPTTSGENAVHTYNNSSHEGRVSYSSRGRHALRPIQSGTLPIDSPVWSATGCLECSSTGRGCVGGDYRASYPFSPR